MDLLEPPSLRSQAFLSLDAAISLPLARFMIENRRRTSAETQKRLELLRDGRGQVNSGCGFKIFAPEIPPPRISRSATVDTYPIIKKTAQYKHV